MENTKGIGGICLHHSFDGAVKPGRGYFRCNGQILNQENYDAMHGPNAFDWDGIRSSPLVGSVTPFLQSEDPAFEFIVKVV